MTRYTQVLVVEDDEQTRNILARALSEAGFRVAAVASVDDAVGRIADEIDVALVDIQLGDQSGLEVLVAAQLLTLPPPVILFTGYASLESSIAALRGCAFDYLIKPVATPDLIATIERAAASRARHSRRLDALRVLVEELAPPTTSVVSTNEHGSERTRFLQVGELQINTHRRIAAFKDRPLHLTPTEYALLVCLAETPGRLVSSDEIVRQTHGYSAKLTDAQALLRGHIRNLRRKIPDGYIVTVRGNGYMLASPENEEEP